MGFFGLLGVFGACGAFRMVKGFPITDVFQCAMQHSLKVVHM
eukprot:SAG31_NODE_123_length_23712_cov_41.426291_11_plen_42_part_00